jgi:hypothetical protein
MEPPNGLDLERIPTGADTLTLHPQLTTTPTFDI